MKNNKKRAMVLAELLFALFFCGVIMVLSISMFKSGDVTKTPHIYSMMKNLPLINKSVMDDCYRDGVCSTQTILPDNLNAYCTRLSNNIVTSGEVNCTDNSTKETLGGVSYSKNLTFASGVKIYNMLSDANVISWNNNGYIDVFLTAGNEKNSEKKLGRDIFPLRIFKNGIVIPGLYNENDNVAIQAYDDDEFFAYRVVLNEASVRNGTDDTGDRYSREISTVAVEDGTTVKTRFAFREAVCLANGRNSNSDKETMNVMSRYYPDKTSIDCSGFDLAPACDFSLETNPNKDDHSAFCVPEPVRPTGSGVFKIFGI